MTTSISVDAGTGLKKCRPRKFSGRCSSRGQPGDGQGGGVGREVGVGGKVLLHGAERGDLQVPVLRNGLDHELAVPEVGVVHGHGRREASRPGRASGRRGRCDLAAADSTRSRAAGRRLRRARRPGRWPLDQEGVGDAGAHAAAAEDADRCGEGWRGGAGCSVRLLMLLRRLLLLFFLSRNACMRSNFAWDSKSMPWARVSISGWTSRGAWNTALVIRTARGSCRAMRSARRGPRPAAPGPRRVR